MKYLLLLLTLSFPASAQVTGYMKSTSEGIQSVNAKLQQIELGAGSVTSKTTRVVSATPEDKVSANKVFTVSTGESAVSLENTEVNQLLIANPTGSGKTLKIYFVSVLSNVIAPIISYFNGGEGLSSFSITTPINLFKIYVSPTITSNGTLLTPISMQQQTVMPASGMSAYKTPSASNRGNLLTAFTSSISFGNNLYLNPGQKILVTSKANTVSLTNSINCFWVEE